MFLLIACQKLEIKNQKVCTVAGIIQAGANCATTLSGEKSEMTYEEFIYFLEPQSDRSGAMAQSADDYSETKVALEQACILLKNKCTYEMKRIISNMEIMLDLGIEAKENKKKMIDSIHIP